MTFDPTFDPQPVTVRHNEAQARFEIDLEGHLAVAEYVLQDGVITFTHTWVPPQLGGRGLGSQLAAAGLAHAREGRLQVIPRCAFIAAYMRQHPETHDLVPPRYRAALGR